MKVSEKPLDESYENDDSVKALDTMKRLYSRTEKLLDFALSGNMVVEPSISDEELGSLIRGLTARRVFLTVGKFGDDLTLTRQDVPSLRPR